MQKPRFIVLPGVLMPHGVNYAVADEHAGPNDWVVADCRKREWAEEVAAGLEARHQARLAMREDPAP